MRIARVFALVALMVASSVDASAALITFVHSGTGSGTLNGVSFGPAAFTITATADTDNVTFQNATTPFLDHDQASIDITGVGSFDFTTGTRTFFSDTSNIVGFSRSTSEGSADLFYSGVYLVAGWQMQTSIGPINGPGTLLQWGGSSLTPVMTTGGRLIFFNGSGPSTFTAAVAPEPASMLLLGTGLLGAGFRRWRQKRT